MGIISVTNWPPPSVRGYMLAEALPNQPTNPAFSFTGLVRVFFPHFFFFFLIRAIVGMSTLFFSKFPYNATPPALFFFSRKIRFFVM